MAGRGSGKVPDPRIHDEETDALQRERARGERIEKQIGGRAFRNLERWLEERPIHVSYALEYLVLLRNRTHSRHGVRKPVVRSVRADVWDKTDGHCYYCGKKLHPFRDFTMDHIVPASKGGSSGLENLVPACDPCNVEKADQAWVEGQKRPG